MGVYLYSDLEDPPANLAEQERATFIVTTDLAWTIIDIIEQGAKVIRGALDEGDLTRWKTVHIDRWLANADDYSAGLALIAGQVDMKIREREELDRMERELRRRRRALAGETLGE